MTFFYNILLSLGCSTDPPQPSMPRATDECSSASRGGSGAAGGRQQTGAGGGGARRGAARGRRTQGVGGAGEIAGALSFRCVCSNELNYCCFQILKCVIVT